MAQRRLVPAPNAHPARSALARPVLPALAALCLSLIGGCRSDSPSSDSAPCRCTPGNVSHIRSIGDAAPMDGRVLLDRLRRHQSLVDERRPPRDIKVFDDELRHTLIDFCQPCSDWVGERLTMEQMFPLDRLGSATSAVCMGLVLRDGTLAYGDARPRACR